MLRSLSLILLLGGGVLSAAAAARGDSGPAPADWEQLPLTEPVVRLDAPASGAFFARTRTGYLRSDDGGISWASVPLPGSERSAGPDRDAVIVDPTDHTVMFAEGRDGVYRSVGDPVSWGLVLPLMLPVQKIAVSPADPSVLYVAAAQGSGSLGLWRSDDRGEHWTRIEAPSGPGAGTCVITWDLLAPHASVRERVMSSWTCYAGFALVSGASIRLSTDSGVSWSTVHRRSGRFPRQVVGGATANPDRLYMVVFRAMATGGYLARSDDGGVTWTDVFPDASRPTPVSLAMDPTNPDRIFLGLSDADESAVLTSTDAGQTWSGLGSVPIGQVRSLQLGVDGAWLFAATSEGLWRYPLRPLNVS